LFDVAGQYEVTSVGVNPAKDRAYRMRMYFATMMLRVLCIVSLFWVRGPWIILVAIGAIVLPYVAVLIANAVSHVGGEAHETPTPLELTSGEMGDASASADARPAAGANETAQSDVPAASALIVVDAPTERRAARDEKSRDEKNSDEKNTDEAGSNGDTGSAGDAA